MALNAENKCQAWRLTPKKKNHRHRAVDDRTCTGHILGVPVLSRVLHVLPKYCTIAIDTGPSTIELVLDISSVSRYCLVYYTYYHSTAPLPSTQGRRRSNLHRKMPATVGSTQGVLFCLSVFFEGGWGGSRRARAKATTKTKQKDAHLSLFVAEG